ncbi:MAG: hypothetical protein GVY32_09765 [Gammaproteobacteria bacterium]|jgi:hypothetical protein|nr:hypothetical protein [Gammaproteobacteria bacterium]
MNTTEHGVTDQMISAYLDGALDEGEARMVERAAEDDPRLARRLAQMVRNDRMLRRHFQSLAREPVPEAINALLEPSPEIARPWWRKLATSASGWAALPAPLQMAGAVAALAVVGIGVWTFLEQGLGPSAGRHDSVVARALPSTNADLSGLLDRQASGEAVAFGDGALAIVDMSFEHAQGRYCRQYRVAPGAESPSFAAVACRFDGNWHEVLVERIDAAIGESGHFHAASGPGSALIDGYILEHMSGDVIVGDSEASLIREDWSKP